MDLLELISCWSGLFAPILSWFERWGFLVGDTEVTAGDSDRGVLAD